MLPVEALDPAVRPAEIGPDVVVDPDIVGEPVAAAVLHDHLQHAVRQHERRGDIRHRQLLPDLLQHLPDHGDRGGREPGVLAAQLGVLPRHERYFLVLFGCG